MSETVGYNLALCTWDFTELIFILMQSMVFCKLVRSKSKLFLSVSSVLISYADETK